MTRDIDLNDSLTLETEKSSARKALGELKLLAMNMLAVREHSVTELRNKLGQKLKKKQKVEQNDQFCRNELLENETNRREELIGIVIKQLLEDKLLDEQRFTESFIRSRISKGSGPLKIRHELANRGISDDLIDEHLDESYEFWHESAKAVRSKRFGSQLPNNYQEQSKQSRFLYQRGFSSELIRRLFNDKSA